jgi:hypothetical protein
MAPIQVRAGRRIALARAQDAPPGKAEGWRERSTPDAIRDLQQSVGNLRTTALLRQAILARDGDTKVELPADVKRYLEGRTAAARKRLTKAQIKFLEAWTKNRGISVEKTRGDRLVIRRIGEQDRVVKIVEELQEEVRTGVVTMRLKEAGVRPKKNFLSKPLAHLERGDRVTLLKKEDGWIFVRTTEGIEGWLNQSDLVLPTGMFPVQMNPEGWKHERDDLEFRASPWELPEGRYGEGSRGAGE